MAQIITYVTQGLEKIQLLPVALVCDQITCNRNAFKILGATGKNPLITANSSKLFTIFDVPHLLKSLRNNFMNPKLYFRINVNPVSWQDLVKTVQKLFK